MIEGDHPIHEVLDFDTLEQANDFLKFLNLQPISLPQDCLIKENWYHIKTDNFPSCIEKGYVQKTEDNEYKVLLLEKLEPPEQGYQVMYYLHDSYTEIEFYTLLQIITRNKPTMRPSYPEALILKTLEYSQWSMDKLHQNIPNLMGAQKILRTKYGIAKP